jgi:hypothetical protein
MSILELVINLFQKEDKIDGNILSARHAKLAFLPKDSRRFMIGGSPRKGIAS